MAPKKWFSGEVRAGARAAEIAQCHHEKGQTHSVGEGLTSIPEISAIYLMSTPKPVTEWRGVRERSDGDRTQVVTCGMV
jgi:hypothetical protein